MKPSFMFTLLLLSVLLSEAQGIRFEKLSISANTHQEHIIKTSSSNGDDGSAMATVLSSGINRKLMTKTISSSHHTNYYSKNYKNDPELDVKFTHGQIGKEESLATTSISVNQVHRKTKAVSEGYPDAIDITGMDYSPAKRKPPIHN